MMNSLSWTEWRSAALAALAALSIAAGGAYGLVNVRQHQDSLNARSSLFNCQQIELIKVRIRTAVQQSITELPNTEYYKTHPKELATALANANATLKDFEAFDCYNLPAVKEAGIDKPRRGS